MELLTITIGRNISNAPMSDERWAEFQADVVEFVRDDLAGQVFGPFTGLGEWQGVTEESAVVTALVPPLAYNMRRVTRVLEGMAARYQQDAIAWSVGEARLAERTAVVAYN